jgi:dipeptidyl aminopeptidase/acylaminoacyl peptidase
MAKTYHSFGWLAAAAAAGVLVAVGMLMLTIVVMVEPAGAAFPGKNGKIAFQCGAEICTMNPNGQGVDTLTNNSVGDFSPAWSPGGGKIAFVSARDDAKGEIYTMNANGQGVDRLTNNTAIDSAPAWSADGNKIAFVSNRDGNYEIYTMNANGQGVDRLTNNSVGDFSPAWSPGGGKIAFESARDDASGEIYTINPNGQGIDRLTNNTAGDGDPNWSPGGGKIAFVSNRTNNTDIYTMNANGQGVDNLTNNPGLDEWPAWSPDGNKIAFHSERSGDSLIYTMNANGQGLDTLTNKSDYSPDWQPLSAAPKPGTPNNKTAPRVLSTSPKANAKAVAPKASLRATFSEKMRASSINGKTFKLFKKNSTKKLSARVTYNAATKKATLNPTTSLRKGLTYKSVVTTGAKDVAGTSLDQKRNTKGLQQKVWVFTVRR